MVVIGSEQIKVTVLGCAVDSVEKRLRVQSLMLGAESWRFELKLKSVKYWMI